MNNLSIKKYNKLKNIIDTLSFELGRRPLANEVFIELGYNIGKITIEEVQEWLSFILDDENIEEKKEEDFELSIKYSIKNYEMQKIRIKRGLRFIDLAKLTGIGDQVLCKIENCKTYPSIEIQNKIADVLVSKKELLFPTWLVYFETVQKENRNKKIIPIKNLQIEAPEVLELSDGTDLYLEVDRSILQDKVFDALSILSPKERRIIEMRYGLVDGVQRQLEEVGREFGVTRERIRQLEAKAQEKLRQSQAMILLNKE